MPSLSQWLRRPFKSRQQTNSPRSDTPGELPFHTDAAYAIGEGLQKKETRDDNFGLFARLPPEIRRQILAVHFGNLTFHIELTQEHTPTPSKRPVIRRRDSETSKTWQWTSCLCQRDGKSGFPTSPLHYDQCLENRQTESGPLKCQLGILGWLLSCHQAYKEGSEVLYGANQFSFKDGPLLNAILHQQPRLQRYLLLPWQLALMARVEIGWQYVLFQSDPSLEAEQREAFVKTISAITATFPNLATLQLSFRDGLYSRPSSPEQVLVEVDEVFLKVIARLVTRSHHCALDLIVALPTVLLYPLMHRAKRKGKDSQARPPPLNGAVRDPRTVWHSIDEDHSKEKLQVKEPTVEGQLGFWIAPGEESNLRFDYKGTASLASQTPQVFH